MLCCFIIIQAVFTKRSGCGPECKLDEQGANYCGTVSNTETGKTCQRWDTQGNPHYHSHTSADNFPDATLRYCDVYMIHAK